MRAALFPVLGISLASALLSAQSAGPAAAPRLAPDPEWVKMPPERTEIGSLHGDVAVSAEGSVRQRFAILGPSAGLQVYAPDGRFLRNVPGAPSDLHGFVIRGDAGVEYLFGTRLAAG